MTLNGEGSSGDERRKRQEALRALAEGAPLAPTPVAPAPSASMATPFGRPSRRWPRWVIAIVSALALVAVVALVVAHFQQPPARHAPTTYAIDVQTLGVACLAGVAWSPDNAQVAVVGTRQTCYSGPDVGLAPPPNVVVFLDAVAGKSTSQLAPDPPVRQALKKLGAPASAAITYTGAIWSPDGARLALPFLAQYMSGGDGSEGNPGRITYLVGLDLVSVNGAQASAYLISEAGTLRFTGEWNLKTGKPVLLSAIPSNQVIETGIGALTPAALRYTWRADGALTPSDLLNTTSELRPPLGPVGNPDGGASFTVWQPMSIFQNSGDPVHPVSPAPFAAFTTILAWSPDGTYLLDADFGPWRIQPSKQPVPGPAQLKAAFMDKAPLLPLRDAALDAALNSLPAKENTTLLHGGFAWSPDGRMLSTYRQSALDTTILTVRDCSSGKALASLTLKGASQASAAMRDGGMRWSPDGKRLLVESGAELFIVGPGALPQE